jgi:predicted HTH transcriptional regulator
MLKMFNMIDIGERAGSGIPNIFRVWREQGWPSPEISERFDPDRIVLSLSFLKSGDKKTAIKSGDKKAAIKTMAKKAMIVAYLGDHASAKSSEISELLGLKASRTRAILSQMIDDGTIVAEGEKRNRVYKLKA